jgi:hypothetical protein
MTMKGPARLRTELEKAALDDRLEAELLDELIREREQQELMPAARATIRA